MNHFFAAFAALLFAATAHAGATGHVSSVDNEDRGSSSGITMEGYRGAATATGEYGVGTAGGLACFAKVEDTSFATAEVFGAKCSITISSTLGTEITPVAYGVYGDIDFSGDGDIPDLYGVYGNVDLSSATTNVDNMTGAYAGIGNSGGGVCTLGRGLWIPDVTGACTTGWAIASYGGDSFHGGRLTLGSTDPPTTDACLDLDSTTCALLPTRLTTAQRDALTPTEGMLIYNDDDDEYQYRNSGAWASIGGGGGSIVLDLADDDSDESTALSEIATTGDTNSVFTEPTADKLLIDLGQNWPTSDTVVTNANLTGPITSVGNATSVASQTGTGSTFVMDTAPDLTTPLDLTGPTSAAAALLDEVATAESYFCLSLTGSCSTTGYNLMSSSAGDTNLYYNVPTTKKHVWRINNASLLELINTSLEPSSPGGITLGRAGQGFGGAFFDSSTTGNTAEITGGAFASNITLTLPTTSGTFALLSDIPAATSEFADDVFRVQDDGDATKEIAFQASGITTATTRTITMPDADVDLTTASGTGGLVRQDDTALTGSTLAEELEVDGAGVNVHSEVSFQIGAGAVSTDYYAAIGSQTSSNSGWLVGSISGSLLSIEGGIFSGASGIVGFGFHNNDFGSHNHSLIFNRTADNAIFYDGDGTTARATLDLSNGDLALTGDLDAANVNATGDVSIGSGDEFSMDDGAGLYYVKRSSINNNITIARAAGTGFAGLVDVTDDAFISTTDGHMSLGKTTHGWDTLYMADHGSEPAPGTNQAVLYADDAGGSTTHMWAADEAGNETQLTAHYDVDAAIAAGVPVDPADPYPAVRYERNRYIGKAAYTYTSPAGVTSRTVVDLPPEEVRSWEDDQDVRVAAALALRDQWDAADPKHREGIPRPKVTQRRQPPKWVKDRLIKPLREINAPDRAPN